MIGIVDYGVGNLFSLKSSIGMIGEEAVVTGDEKVLRASDRIILPGVGAFEDAAAKLRNSGLDQVVLDLAREGRPVMGICLGMQLLFKKSYEHGVFEGLGLINGEITDLRTVIRPELKVPHIGWNALEFRKEHPLLKYVEPGESVYFVHSYFAKEDPVYTVAVSEYDTNVTAVCAAENVMGCQFHPEKSGKTGLRILKAFTEIK